MPKPITPHRSPAHRRACCSLYRALLRQTLDLPSEAYSLEIRETIADHIIRGFHANIRLKSPSRITNGLRASYQALDLLHASANGSAEATASITSLLENYKLKDAARYRLKDELKKARDKAAAKGPQPMPKPERPQQIPKEIVRKITDEPVPLKEMEHPPSSGRRRVPHFVSANGVPFLRYRKPQPLRLSRMINARQQTEIKRWSNRDRMSDLMALGEDEDQWDDLVESKSRSESSHRPSRPAVYPKDYIASDGEHSWIEDTQEVDADLFYTINKTHRDQLELGKRMWEVAKRERELAEQETIERKVAKSRAALERRRGRKRGENWTEGKESKSSSKTSSEVPLVEGAKQDGMTELEEGDRREDSSKD